MKRSNMKPCDSCHQTWNEDCLFEIDGKTKNSMVCVDCYIGYIDTMLGYLERGEMEDDAEYSPTEKDRVREIALEIKKQFIELSPLAHIERQHEIDNSYRDLTSSERRKRNFLIGAIIGFIHH